MKIGRKSDFGLQRDDIWGISVSLVILKTYSIEEEMAIQFSSVLFHDIALYMCFKSMLLSQTPWERPL